MATWRDDYRSWGGTLRASHLVTRPRDRIGAARDLQQSTRGSLLGFGCGRSYGDVALNPGGSLIDVSGINRFLAFDAEMGVLACEGGTRLADILAVVCRPDPDGSGWMLPVTPGTRFVTVAGAIANDVHGKNHHEAGTFGRHVLSFELLRSDGQTLFCSPTDNPELFAATIGGLGLTGLILSATVQMRRVAGLAVEAEDIRFGTLDEFFALAEDSDRDWTYTAAWIDCLAAGADLGRGIYSRARHLAGTGFAPPNRSPRLGMPVKPPMSLATPMSVRAFNALYWRKLGLKGRSARVQSYEPTFYPLDAVGEWNRVYGRKGFFQFQSAVPHTAAPEATTAMLRVIAASGQGSMLSVLKRFGDLPSPGLLSFPMPGVTIALDFPDRGPDTRRLLDRLEAIAIDAGGRLYPAKDSVMSERAFRTGYPGRDRFARSIDPRFSSAFARRVGLLPADDAPESPMTNSPSTTRRVAVFGATSDIAGAVARRYAEAGARLVLIGRNRAALDAQAADLKVRGAADIATLLCDFASLDGLAPIAAQAWNAFGGLDVALVAYGSLPDQVALQNSAEATAAALTVNFTSPSVLIGALADRFERQKSGTIAVISSVAGDRGRKSNYVYGAAKGGLQRLLEGLRHRLHASGVAVLDIRPGFVSTKMTASLPQKGPLWATPDKVAADIAKAIDARTAVLYTPWFWRGIMGVVTALPRPLFHRSSL